MKGKGPFKARSTEAALWQKVDRAALPRHIAIIMDGNGRWAKRRRKPRIAGHRAGVEATRVIVETCARIELPVLTLYAFSLDNWKRPGEETDFLMNLLRRYIRRELAYMKRNNVRLRVIGRWRELPQGVQEDISRAMEETRTNTGLELVVALNYTGRAELVDAARALAESMLSNGLGRVDEEALSRHLYAADLPDPDLLIRTSGEMRISNFLLWQVAYTEIWVTDTLWPDFAPKHLLQAILDYQQRERRFGGLSPEAAKRHSRPNGVRDEPRRTPPGRELKKASV